ncbi:MAG: hypothetical protein AVDCRST_MAG61-2753, partial [uncultured Friedmanniella sp.]
ARVPARAAARPRVPLALPVVRQPHPVRRHPHDPVAGVRPRRPRRPAGGRGAPAARRRRRAGRLPLVPGGRRGGGRAPSGGRGPV